MNDGHIHAPRSLQRIRAGQKRSSQFTRLRVALVSVSDLWVTHLGLVPYGEGLALQDELRERRRAGELPDLLLVLEHPPVYTLGKRTEPTDLPLGENWYRARGIDVCPTDRGGRVTYHGPGQLVAYPIMAIDRVADFVHTMEQAIVDALGDEGIDAEVRETPLTGSGPVTPRSRPLGYGCPARDHARAGGQRRQRRRALQLDRSLWHRPGADDVGRGGDGPRELAAMLPAAAGLPLRFGVRAPPAAGVVPTSARARGRRGVSTRSRAHPGGARVLQMGEVRPFRDRKPEWFKRPAPGGPNYRELRTMIEGQGLHTVCQEAACPNIGECWERGTATFMILGDTCTRRCGFCNVKTGKPTHTDPLEPLRVAQSVKRMGLRHAVVTSVDRDDLPDLGSTAFVAVIRSIRRLAPDCRVEVLTPDFRGEEMPLARVIAERPDVFNHNVETVPRLYPLARRGSRFLRSCRVLRNAKEMGGDEVVTKSGLMTGLGETKEELLEAFALLREHGVQVLTVGQYLRPTRDHLPVVRYWHPEEFAELEREANRLGFDSVAAGPLVRSSYHADQTLEQARGEAGVAAAASA